MNCVFDWCILWSNLFLGFVSSILASGLTASYFYFRDIIRNRKEFSKAEGEYSGDGTSSKASIKYEGGNRLSINLTHNSQGGKRTWKGLITMDNEHYGTLGFQYTDVQKEFGFKRCIITDDGEKMFLISEAPPEQSGEVKYGREVLIREKKES